MNWLLWREYRLNRGILALSGAAILLSYVLGFLIHIFAITKPDDNFGPVLALLWSLLTVALLAGNSIAGERADRSAEFIAFLPLRRSSMLASKLLLHMIAVVVILGVHLLHLMADIVPSGVSLRSLEQSVDANEPVVWFSICLLVTVLLTYSMSWLVSSLQSSPALATMAGLGTPGGIAFCVALVGDVASDGKLLRAGHWEILSMWYAIIGLALAIFCFLLGSWYYLRRGEPLSTANLLNRGTS